MSFLVENDHFGALERSILAPEPKNVLAIFNSFAFLYIFDSPRMAGLGTANAPIWAPGPTGLLKVFFLFSATGEFPFWVKNDHFGIPNIPIWAPGLRTCPGIFSLLCIVDHFQQPENCQFL